MPNKSNTQKFKFAGLSWGWATLVGLITWFPMTKFFGRAFDNNPFNFEGLGVILYGVLALLITIPLSVVIAVIITKRGEKKATLIATLLILILLFIYLTKGIGISIAN